MFLNVLTVLITENDTTSRWASDPRIDYPKKIVCIKDICLLTFVDQQEKDKERVKERLLRHLWLQFLAATKYFDGC